MNQDGPTAASWIGDSVLYQIFIDRFSRSNPSDNPHAPAPDSQPVFCGGTLQGVELKLEHLADLGVNAIWLSPFTDTPAYHGYHVTDFFIVEERFGGFTGLRSLIKTAKSHGLRVMMDFVPNHVHETHPWFIEAKRNPKSRYRDWFFWQSNGDYLKFLDFGELPKLNLDHPDARATIIQAATFWLDEGLDGFRLDHALGPSMDFWGEFRRKIKQHRPDAALLAEVWFKGIRPKCLTTLGLPHRWRHSLLERLGFDVLDSTMKEYARVFDGLLDFSFQEILKREVAHARHHRTDEEIQKLLDRHYARFPSQCSLVSFLDNHDMNRFLFEAGDDKQRLIRALKLQFAQPQPPVLYYGTEIGMSQSGPIHGPHGDLQARRMMDWAHPDLEIQNLCRDLIQQWKVRNRPRLPE
jgi:glycosidase